MRLPSPPHSSSSHFLLALLSAAIHLSCVSLACVFLWVTLSLSLTHTHTHAHTWPHAGINAQAACVLCDQRCYHSKCKRKQWCNSPSASLPLHPSRSNVEKTCFEVHGVILRVVTLSQGRNLHVLALRCASREWQDKTWTLRYLNVIRDLEEWR